jgi:hypothetical protein
MALSGGRSIAIAVVLVAAGAFVSWAPNVSADCHKRYPPCICLQGFILPCFQQTEEMAGVSMGATIVADNESVEGSGYVLLSFRWASGPGSSVPFSIDLESSEVEWMDGEDFTYTHENGTDATEVHVYQHFMADGLDAEVRFTVTAFEGRPNEESWEGTLTFGPGEAGHETTAREMDVVEIALVSGAVGALLGAILAAIVVTFIRKT